MKARMAAASLVVAGLGLAGSSLSMAAAVVPAVGTHLAAAAVAAPASGIDGNIGCSAGGSGPCPKGGG